MASPPDPEDLKTLGGIAAAVGGAILWFVYYVRKGMGSNVMDPATKAMLDGMRKDIERLETMATSVMEKIENAIEHAEETHKGISVELGSVKVCLARVERDVTHLQDRRK